MKFVIGFNKKKQNEFYASEFTKKVYTSLEELQSDVDNWLIEYNEQRPHTRCYCYGKTPSQTFKESKQLSNDKMLDRLKLTPNPGLK